MAVRLTYYYQTYENCPKATKISRSRAKAQLRMRVFAIVLLFLSVLFCFVDSADRWIAIAGIILCSLWLVYLFVGYQKVTEKKIQAALKASGIMSRQSEAAAPTHTKNAPPPAAEQTFPDITLQNVRPFLRSLTDTYLTSDDHVAYRKKLLEHAHTAELFFPEEFITEFAGLQILLQEHDKLYMVEVFGLLLRAWSLDIDPADAQDFIVCTCFFCDALALIKFVSKEEAEVIKDTVIVGLSKKLRIKNPLYVEIKDRQYGDASDAFSCDKAEWQWDTAHELFCEEHQLSLKEELTDEQTSLIRSRASHHIAMFLTWAILNDRISAYHLQEHADAVTALKERRMNGFDFLETCCGKMISAADFADAFLPFLDRYYNPYYLEDYTEYMNNILRKEPLATDFSWEDYDGFGTFMDAVYEQYLTVTSA